MSGHPFLTTNVYIGIAVAFLSMMVYWFFYNRSVRRKEAILKGPEDLYTREQPGTAKRKETAIANHKEPANANHKV